MSLEGGYVDDLELLEEYDLEHDDSDSSRESNYDGHGGMYASSDSESGSPEDADSVFAELKAITVEILSALGGLEEVEGDQGVEMHYVVGDDCLRCLRDLRKLWREGAEDPYRTISHVFAEIGVLQNLIPLLLKTAGGDERFQKIALACTDLLTSITWPVDANAEVREAVRRGESTEDLSHLFALERDMVKYKAAILRQRSGESHQKTGNREVLNCIMRFILLPALSKPRHHRNERDVGTISMSLHFFRNLLAIQDPIATTLSSAEQISNSTLQSELVCTMARSHVLETILMLANSAESRDFGQWNAITLECVYTIFGGEDVVTIAEEGNTSQAAKLRPTTVDGIDKMKPRATSRSSSALASSLNSEAHQRRIALAANGSSRHSRFGTSINFFTADGDVRVARSAASLRKSVEELRQDNVLRSKRNVRRRKRAREEGAPRVKPAWTSAAKLVLRSWADRFLLSSGFETLTRSCLNDIRSEREKVGDLDQARVRVMLVGVFFLDYFLYRRTEDAECEAAAAKPVREQGNTVKTIQQPLATIQPQPQAHQSTTPPLDSLEADDAAEKVQEHSSEQIRKTVEQGTDGREEPSSPSLVNVEEGQQVNNSVNAANDEQPPSTMWTFALMSEWLKPWAFKMVLVRTHSALDSKGWLEMTASLQLWMSLLRLVDCLSRSKVEEEKDLAENLQANHFYHSETLELCVKITRCFTTQSFEFLRCVVAFASVMPRMLEKYSTNKEHIFVRAKRHAKKKKKQQKGLNEEENDEEEEEDQNLDPEAKAELIYTERRFSFDRFQNKLCNRPLVEACVGYLGRWRDYQRPSEELSNVVAVMHRIAIKANDARSFYPAHIRVAFQAILKGPLVAALSPTAPRAVNDCKKLIEFALKKFNKLPSEEKELWACNKAPPRPAKEAKLPREIEVKPGMNRDDQVGIAVGLLAEKGMMGTVTWIKSGLEIASAERVSVVMSIDGRRMWEARKRAEGIVEDIPEPSDEDREAIIEALVDSIPSDEAVRSFEPHELSYDGNSILQEDASTSPPLKLLARLMGLESDESDPTHWRWRVPDHVLPTHLDADVKLIEERLREPLPINGETYEEYVQNARKKRLPKAKQLAPADLRGSDGEDSSSSGSDSSGSVSSRSSSAPRKRKTTRRREDLMGDPRKKKKTFKRRKIETGPLFLQDDIIDSDEDDQVEALWRAMNQNQNQNQNRSSTPSSGPSKAKQRQSTEESDADEDSEEVEMEARSSRPQSSPARRRKPHRTSTTSSETPPTSPSLGNRDGPLKIARKIDRSRNLFLGSSDEESIRGEDEVANNHPRSISIDEEGVETLVNRRTATEVDDDDDDDDDDNDDAAVLRKVRARNALLAAMMDSDDE